MLTFTVCSYVLLFFMSLIQFGISNQKYCANPDNETPGFSDGINVLVYNCARASPGEIPYVNISISNPGEVCNYLNRNMKTVFYTHGFTQKPSSENVQTMIRGLCCEGHHNVVLLDWSKYSLGDNFPKVFDNCQKVGPIYANFAGWLVRSGCLNPENMIFIGHSLGAHVTSFVGKCNPFEVLLMMGLDPANPDKSGNRGQYLQRTDARCVVAINSDQNGFGAIANSTHSTALVHILVNNGTKFQPRCDSYAPGTVPILSPKAFCSHQESVVTGAEEFCTQPYVATRCNDYYSYMAGRCNNNQRITFGLNMNCDGKSGKYYFTTYRGVYYNVDPRN